MCRGTKPGNNKGKVSYGICPQGRQGKFTGECHYCKKLGHKASDCFKKKREQGEQANAAKGEDRTDVVLMALNLADFTNGFEDESSDDEDMPPLIKRTVNQEASDDDDDVPPFNESRVYFDSSDDDSLPPLLTDRFNCPSSSDDDDDDFECSFEHTNTAVGTDDDSENQIGTCTNCSGTGHIGMYCDSCEDQGMIYEKESSSSDTSNPTLVASNQETTVSTPNEVTSTPEVVTSAPDTVRSAPDRVASAAASIPTNPLYTTHTADASGVIWSRRKMGDEMDEFLREVCIHKHMKLEDRRAWILAVKTKLAYLKFTTVCDVLRNLMRINNILITCHRTPFHWDTLNSMAHVGTDTLNRRVTYGYEYDRDLGRFKEEDDIAMTMVEKPKSKYRFGKNTWLGDSAASTHMGNDDSGMFDVEVISSSIKIGDGKTLTATKIGKKRLTVVQEDGTTTDIILEDYKYVPDLWVNLFSIPKSLGKGWNIGNKGVRIFLTKGDTKITFDREFATHKGLVLGVEMLPRTIAIDSASPALDKGKILNVNRLHRIFGHIG